MSNPSASTRAADALSEILRLSDQLDEAAFMELFASLARKANGRNLSIEISKFFNKCLEDAEEFPISSDAITRPFVGTVATSFAGGGAASASVTRCPWGSRCRYFSNGNCTNGGAEVHQCQWGSSCRYFSKGKCTNGGAEVHQ